MNKELLHLIHFNKYVAVDIKSVSKPKKHTIPYHTIPYHTIPYLIINLSNRSVAWIGLVSAAWIGFVRAVEL